MHFGVLKVASTKKKEKKKVFHLLWSIIVVQKCETTMKKKTNKSIYEAYGPCLFHERVVMHLQINE
jgi:hypothetical protein